MSGSTGTVESSEPFIGISCRVDATSGPRPKISVARAASSLDMVPCPSKADVTQTLCRPTALAMASKVRFFAFLASRIRSVACFRVSIPSVLLKLGGSEKCLRIRCAWRGFGIAFHSGVYRGAEWQQVVPQFVWRHWQKAGDKLAMIAKGGLQS